MPKMKNLTDAELTALHISADSFLGDMHSAVDLIEKGYVDRIESPLETAKWFSLIAAAAARLSTQILIRAEMQKNRDELEALKRTVKD